MSQVQQKIWVGLAALSLAALAGCQPDYSPNTYSAAAMQQANKVDLGTVVGFREVKISADGTVGTVTGGAAGGILGAGMASPEVPTALTALGGTVVGGLVGNAVEHATGDTTGWEYIVRETKGDLISVTQREPKPIAIGQQVLVIEGKQARIVPDYASTPNDQPAPATLNKQKPASLDVPTVTSAAAATVAPAPSNTPGPAAAASPTPPASTTGEAASAASAASSTATSTSPPPTTTPASTPATSTPASTPTSTAASPPSASELGSSNSPSSNANGPATNGANGTGASSPGNSNNNDNTAAKPPS